MLYQRSCKSFLLLLLLYAVAAVGQEGDPVMAEAEEIVETPARGVRFSWPPDGTVVPLGQAQIIELEIFGIDSDNEYPVVFNTTLGEFRDSDERIIDLQAQTSIASSTVGEATITAQIGTYMVDGLTLVFAEPDDSTERHMYRVADDTVDLTVYENLIGIQIRTSATAQDVTEIVSARGYEVAQSYYRGVYIFRLPGPYSLNSISFEARKLEEDFDFVKDAGFVVSVSDQDVLFIATDRIIIGFEGTPTWAQRKKLAQEYGVTDLEVIEGCQTIHVATLASSVADFTEDIAAEIEGESFVTFAQANYIGVVQQDRPDQSGDEAMEDCPAQSGPDPRLCEQWFHGNYGNGDAVLDADIDTFEAWRISDGSVSRPLIAIVDSGFSNDHPDYLANLWVENDEVGRDFADGDQSSLLDSPTIASSHGTSVAGIVGAIADNEYIGRGVCPNCRLMLLRHDGDTESTTRAICFATGRGAVAINNSWGPLYDFESTRHAIRYATRAGVSVVFAMESSVQKDNCADPDTFDLSTMPSVIAVSSATNQDLRTPSGFGRCMDVLAPTRRSDAYGIVTTGVVNTGGGPANGVHTNFGGTSAAAPMVAGTIGLIRDRAPSLSRDQVQRVLQDTADRIDAHGASYDAEYGFSMPEDIEPTHGYGRINAFEAVRLVAPVNPQEADSFYRGRGGQDLLIRDHRYDWGNTEQDSSTLLTSPRSTISVLNSIDIRLDTDETQYPLQTADSFLQIERDNYVPGESANVYVRVRNRGPNTVRNAEVTLYWTLATGDLPPLPDDFWSEFPHTLEASTDVDGWNALKKVELTDVRYSGPSVAGCPNRPVPECLPLNDPPTDEAVIVKFEMPIVEASGAQRLALLAIAHSSDGDPALGTLEGSADLLDPLYVARNDNNAALWVEQSSPPDMNCSVVIAALVGVAILLIT